MAAMYRRRCRAVRRVCARPNRTALGRHVVGRRVSASALAVNRYRFQCREWSAATGLVNFRARWYDAVTGRWLSKDPIGLSGGLNLYAFCGNDLVNRLDLYGLSPWGDFWCKVQAEHDSIWAEAYDSPVMAAAETLSLLTLVNLASDALQSIGVNGIDALADAEIVNGKFAGANTSGNIITKIKAAKQGAEIAKTTATLRGGLNVVSKGAGVATVAATLYHGFSHIGAYGAAIVVTLNGWNQ